MAFAFSANLGDHANWVATLTEGFALNSTDFLGHHQTYHYDDFRSSNSHLRSLQLAVGAEDLDFQHVSVGCKYWQMGEDFSYCLHKLECPV